jgi:predicted dehydrogenase
MKFLIAGLGSMGKRRIRNLHALGCQEIIGVDPRQDRCEEARSKYGILAYTSLDKALTEHTPDVFIVSTPPQIHMEYANQGVDLGCPCFIEASVVDAAGILALNHKAVEKGVLIAPSCTMRYSAGPKLVKELIHAGVIGRPLNLNYQIGQYLPDWHPWERIEEFYVSRRETGGCREIVPFELTWINEIFGKPVALSCVKTKLTDMSADVDDIYHCLLRYPDGMLANITVEVISRPRATREMRIIGTEGQLIFSADENCVRYINQSSREWQRTDLARGTIEKEYINPEEPYIDELGAFIGAVTSGDSKKYPNRLVDDVEVLELLYRLEEFSEKLL